MTSFTKIRKARTYHRCTEGGWAHDTTIRPGELYAVATLPPGGEFGYEGWLQLKICSACINPNDLIQAFRADKQGRALVQAIHDRKATRDHHN